MAFIMPGRSSPVGAAYSPGCYKYAAPTGLGGGLQTCCYKYAAPTGLDRPPPNPL
ncbi:hypothetical protein [Desulfonema magnum]|uniref:Uncharacterized protein n=1 Tax=Desulfonema magnum TaxID=45655 RepID=A0A975BGR3_9BACT|nr:hypothetical protein [Desulfonema magnum]QTA85112.1 Uncharacterized protein dnm_011160 [Desulfonema magnum]QTA85771.1 Uncharacterized protein dnm_017860 [Desulfonema magnum]